MSAVDDVIRIEGVNGIEVLEIGIGRPGVQVIRGANGAGKSCTLRAVEAVLGSKAAVVEPTDGEDQGIVQGAGVTLRVGARRTRSGTPSVELLDSSAISRLIDPRIQDSTAAAKQRVAALLEIVDPPVTPDVVEALSGGLPLGVRPTRGVSVVEIAQQVKRAAETYSRAREDDAQRALGEASAARLVLGGLPTDAPTMTPEAAQRAAQDAQRAAERIKIEAQARQTIEERQREAREAAAHEPDMQEARGNVLEAEALAAGARAAREAIEQRIAELRRDLARAETHEEARRNDLQAQRRAEKAVEEAHRCWARQQEILHQPVTGPTPQDVEVAEAAARVAEAAAESARLAGEAEQWRAREREAIAAHNAAAEQALKGRETAASISARLSEVLASAGVERATVEDGRLVVGGQDFERRLSTGQRVRFALTTALQALTRRGYTSAAPPVLALDPSLWMALDQQRQHEVAQLAREVGVCLITEEPAMGRLRIEEVVS